MCMLGNTQDGQTPCASKRLVCAHATIHNGQQPTPSCQRELVVVVCNTSSWIVAALCRPHTFTTRNFSHGTNQWTRGTCHTQPMQRCHNNCNHRCGDMRRTLRAGAGTLRVLPNFPAHMQPTHHSVLAARVGVLHACWLALVPVLDNFHFLFF